MIPAPASVVSGALESSETMHAFNEQQAVTLASAIAVDINSAGTYDSSSDLLPTSPATNIPAGTRVNSHFVHADPVGTDSIITTSTLTFPTDILGVLVRVTRLNASDA